MKTVKNSKRNERRLAEIANEKARRQAASRARVETMLQRIDAEAEIALQNAEGAEVGA